MADQATSTATAGSPAAGSFDALWKTWSKSAAWKDKLHKQATHKALDIPEDDVISASNQTVNSSGMGWKEMAVIGGTLLGGGGLFGLMQKPATVPVAPPAATAPVQATPAPPAYPGPSDSSYDISFYQLDKDGNPVKIDVPRLPTILRDKIK